jgi:hypothetical protein
MSLLRQLIKESLLLEKRIAQLSANIEITFAFDVDRTHHAYIRRKREGIEGYDEREISNGEIKYIIQLSIKQIAEKIISGEIKDGEAFVIKSPEKSIAMSVVPNQEMGLYWKLYITTVFRETYDNPFRVGRDQLIILVD